MKRTEKKVSLLHHLLISGFSEFTGSARGIELRPGMEIDAMDIPVLYWQLTSRLLERASSGGPTASFPDSEIKVSENTKAIRVGTPSAQGEYDAPWTLTAKLSHGTNNQVQYLLYFQCTDHSSKKLLSPFKITGTWEDQQPKPEIADSMSLAGWKILSLGPTIGMGSDSSQTLDYGASSSSKKATSVGDLRKLANTQP